jgi:hypothetical protein
MFPPKPNNSIVTNTNDNEANKISKNSKKIIITINKLKEDSNKCLNEF